MTTQRATLALLLLLVIGVWGLLLRPAVTSIPVQAQTGDGNTPSRGLLGTANGVYLYAPSGNIYHFGADLTLRDRAFPGEDDLRRSTYAVVHERQ
jgi:hypothetical protein